VSYTNNAGQPVKVGCRVAYAGHRGHLYVGKVLGFTRLGSPRVELENSPVSMVRNRWRQSEVYVKYSGANIWDRRPHTHMKHKTSGHLITMTAWRALSVPEKGQYDYDPGMLGSEWVEFEVPRVFTIVKRSHVVVIEAAA
jgi:hypothetical protein